MNTPTPHPHNPAVEAFLTAAVDGLQTLARQKRSIPQPPNHRAILSHGQQQSSRFHVKPAPMPQSFNREES